MEGAELLRKNDLESPVEPGFDIVYGVAGFLLQAAVPFVLLAIFVFEVIVGELAPLLLGFALHLVPVAASFQLGVVVDVVLIEVHDSRKKMWVER